MIRMDERLMIRVAPFGMDLVLSIYGLAAPLLLIELKASPVELGLIGTMTAAVHMALAHRMGPLSDRFGRRRLILLSPLLLALSALLAAATHQVKVILMLSALNGLCLSLFWPPLQAWVSELRTETDVARNIGTLNMAWTAAYLLGPIFSGFLFSLHSRLPFLCAAAFAVCLFLLGYTSIHDRKAAISEKPATQSETRKPIRNFLYAVWIANFVSWFVLGNTRYLFPKLATELGNGPQTIGILMGCLGFSLFVGFFALRTDTRWHFRRRYLFGAQALGAMGLLIIFAAKEAFWFALALALVGLSASVTYYSSLLYAVRLSAQKGKGTGRHESILSMGALLGPLLGGLAAQATGLRTPYLICFGFLLVAVFLELVLLGRISLAEREIDPNQRP